jgi:hypothetical protein
LGLDHSGCLPQFGAPQTTFALRPPRCLRMDNEILVTVKDDRGDGPTASVTNRRRMASKAEGRSVAAAAPAAIGSQFCTGWLPGRKRLIQKNQRLSDKSGTMDSHRIAMPFAGLSHQMAKRFAGRLREKERTRTRDNVKENRGSELSHRIALSIRRPMHIMSVF